ncbi:GIY-YIG nuclease family protein [Clostridioides sp. ES-S-0005-03]|uniref:GIY-YIG nuclease family protein n=1 Tax=unclassified Clostridioides TaxID=2635829 RepID=UPI001D116BEA|nr:GIY-YIG nuclease family protein [Clostridioides sp. ES-S-0173-01]MCC0682707.1 GIY-YIG nuclease family protein [Clostridioides sp. ES-S-0005-03]UDN49620.1 GIY-YIG nuclease family protein [Clostridioides sp. ES-S-0173-01]
MYYVYKYIEPENDNCVYVGKTKNLSSRHGEHLTNKKEEWCTTKLKLEYIEVEDRYTTDYFEMYLINKLEPRFNKVGKGKINTANAKFEYNGVWIEYSKEKFLKDLKSKGKNIGIDCKVNQRMLDILKEMRKLNLNTEISYENNNLKIKYSYKDIKPFKDIIEPEIINISYNAIKCSGFSQVLSWEGDFVVVRIHVLKRLKDLPYLEDEMYKLGKLINEVLSIIRLDYTWEHALELFGC